MTPIDRRIAEELGARPAQVAAAIALLDEGATVPFVARYRKEATGGLDDAQLRTLEERLHYLRELEDRRTSILDSIRAQERLTPELEAEILAADTKTRLEDLYLPYKPKRRTKAQIAREAGLGPLAEALLADPGLDPETEAAAYLNPDQGVADAKGALEGARQILMERFAEDPGLVGELRERLRRDGVLQATLVEGKAQEGAKFRDYFDFAEPLARIPSHRALALLRGRNAGVLSLRLLAAADAEEGDARCQGRVARRFGIADRGRPGDAWLLGCARWAWRVKLFTRLELELMNQLRERAEAEAIRVFAANLGDLLLAAPAGRLPLLGLDPGLRTGVKLAALDATGKVVDTATLYPHVPRRDWDGAIACLARIARASGARLVAIGNGTASRETERLVREAARRYPDLGLVPVVVSEAGASVYSASELASRELPDLDVSLRGAVSIARRLQDPLAELVKIEPRAIGVGQYQHDVNQTRLARALENVVEDCVNSVGVDLNTASPSLLRQVSGLTSTLAENLIRFRDEHGAFRRRKDLLQVPRLGPKAFQQAAGFLRIADGENPLDASAVHPEAYPVVERIAKRSGHPVRELIGNGDLLRGLDPREFADERFGLPTVRDILAELEKPGRDPRPEFRTARFAEGVEELVDLRPGMVLEGTVTNVTNFGAFVDVGVHQDGLVHVSALADHFVKDPRSLVRSGQVVKVRVLEVDLERRRIALSMRWDAKPGEGRKEDAGARPPRRGGKDTRTKTAPKTKAGPKGTAMADALAAAIRNG